MSQYPQWLETAIQKAHSSWHAVIRNGIDAVRLQNPDYFSQLTDTYFLPTEGRIFAAFSQPLDKVRYILIGEGPYPREQSASGYCFMDAAVESLWSEDGLSKQVNKAVSLRNFMKMLLVAEGSLSPDRLGKEHMTQVVQDVIACDSSYIRTIRDLQTNLLNNGFLLLNATLVFRKEVSATKETKAWIPFLHSVLQALDAYQVSHEKSIVMVLWGKLAGKFSTQFQGTAYTVAVSEHPYNLSFINNAVMQDLFRPMHLLKQMYRQGISGTS